MAVGNAREGRLEIQTDGMSGSAGYVNLGLVGSARMTSQPKFSETPRRDVDIVLYTQGKKDVEVTATAAWDSSDTLLAAIFAAHQAGTHVGVMFLDEDTGEGIEFDALIGMEWDQAEDNTKTVNLTFKPTYVDTAPAWQ